MEDGPKEKPFNQPKVENKISPEQSKHITDKGGIAINPANPNTPSFMIKHQDNPNSLPEQGKPKAPSKN